MTQPLRGKKNTRIITDIIFVMSVIILLPFTGYSQQNFTHWEITAQATCHPPIKASLDVGTERLKFLPCAGWNARVAYKLGDAKKLEYFVYASRGSTPFWYNIKIHTSKYPQLRDESVMTFYETHPYWTLGVFVNYNWKGNDKFSFFIGNRFYISADTKTSIVSYDVNTLQELTVFQAETATDFRFFCPEINLSFSTPVWKRFPSWNYELMLSYAPVKVVEGGYTFFPDYPDGSLGYFKLQQSYLGIGIKYRRVKKED